MPLTLITGPANAEKARAVLDAYRAALDREPILVVPTMADVEHYRRELAAAGTVFGPRVARFDWLVEEIARRAGVAGRPIGSIARERLAAAAAARSRLDALAASAATPGFSRALVRLVAELEELRVEPPRFVRALRDWAGADSARAAYADELGGLFLAYRRILESTGRTDRELHTAAALDALRLKPARWRGTPVFFYGFDDLTPLQQDAVETLAGPVGTPVTLSLTYEAGREAFRARARAFEELRPLAGGSPPALDPLADHYAPQSRAALHHLERSLFEPEPARVEAGAAIRLLEAGGERAEVELVGSQVAALLRRDGYAAEDVAVVWRDPQAVAPLVEEIFGAYGIPFALRRRIPAGHTALGRGVVALLRCALLEGTADDLLAWLRTPGLLRVPELADRLEVECRRSGATTAAAARALWEGAHWPLDALDRVAAAQRRGPEALCERLAAEAASLLAAAWKRQARVLAPDEVLEARVAAELRRTLRELAALGAADSALVPGAADLATLLADVDVLTGDPPGPGRVAVSSPLAIRARRVRALFLCSLQEGTFPRPARPEPFLGDQERLDINRVAGLRLRHHEDALAAERFLFYAAASRPTDLLALSWRTSDDEGNPLVRSFFVDDVTDLFTPALDATRATRRLGDVGWPDGDAPTPRDLRRASAEACPPAAGAMVTPLTDPEVLAALRGRATWSASEIETWASCPVKWLVERLLRPAPLVPDPEPLVRGLLAHRALEEVFRELPERDGTHPLGEAELSDARRALHGALERLVAEHRVSVHPERLAAEVRRLEADLDRYLEHAAEAGSAFAPSRFEVRFGGPDDAAPAARLADGELCLAGRIDRVDVHPGTDKAIVYDYKGKSATPHPRWRRDRKLQMGLYLLAARQVLGLEPVGGLYQPLGGKDPRPRGILLEGADPGLASIPGDHVPAQTFDDVLAGVLEDALAVVREIRDGALEPRPGSCAYEGGCSYPSICRCEA